MTTFFETGLGLSTYAVYVKGIPWLKAKVKLTRVEQGYHPQNPVSRFLFPTLYWVPNRWWYRMMALQATAFVTVFIVAIQIGLSVGWRNPFASSVSGQGLTMPGWIYDLAFARSNDQPNGAHLMSYIGIPIIGLYAMWKFKDIFMGLLMGAFFVAIHEGIWEPLYYLAYSQYLSWALLTNVLKDVSFASMIMLFIMSFWKYPDRKIPMKKFTWVIISYTVGLLVWFFLPNLLTDGYYPWFPITTINNFEYGKGVYSETAFWADPVIAGIEVFSWFGLYLMMQYVLLRWKPESIRVA